MCENNKKKTVSNSYCRGQAGGEAAERALPVSTLLATTASQKKEKYLASFRHSDFVSNDV